MARTHLGTNSIRSFFANGDGLTTPQPRRDARRTRDAEAAAPEPPSQKKLRVAARTPKTLLTPETEVLEISDDEIEESEADAVSTPDSLVRCAGLPMPIEVDEEDVVVVVEDSHAEPLRINTKDEAEEPVLIPPKLARHLKPHQIDGVRFCYDRFVPSLKKLEAGDRGSGAILAHSMGLGKTLQAVTLVRTLLLDATIRQSANAAAAPRAEGSRSSNVFDALGRSTTTPVHGSRLRNCIVLCPVSVLANWKAEFRRWDTETKRKSRIVQAARFDAAPKPSERESLFVEILDGAQYKTGAERAAMLRRWSRREGAVLVMSYDMMRRLVEHKQVRRQTDRNAITAALVDPGPDVLIMDEGHVLKNANSGLAEAVLRVRTRRRLVLTGTPLQNNLLEYFTMVDCVKRGALGERRSFVESFVNPIKAGQARDATRTELRSMRRKAHALRKRLERIVHRRGVDVLRAELPPLRQHVLSLPPTPLQERLLGPMLAECRRKKEEDGVSSVLDIFQWSLRAGNHPSVLLRAAAAGDDLDDIGPDLGSVTADGLLKSAREIAGEQRLREKLRWKKVLEAIPRTEREAVDQSRKMHTLLALLRACRGRNEKVLLFSQSLLTLDFIEDKVLREALHWYPNVHFARIDGATAFQDRQRICERFNDKGVAPTQASILGASSATAHLSCAKASLQLVLISTRAGNMGINLTGANHVVLFDCSWNPANDMQAIFRAYRYGQSRPVHVYRLVTTRSIEERVYKRQVAKAALALRIVDDQAAGRHYTRVELEDLFGRDEDDIALDENADKTLGCPAEDAQREAGVAPWSALASVLADLKDSLAGLRVHEHDTLMEEREDEKLAPAEGRLAERVDRGHWSHVATIGAWEVFRVVPGKGIGDPEDPRRAIFFHDSTQVLTQDPPERIAQAWANHSATMEDARRRRDDMEHKWGHAPGARGGGWKTIPEKHLADIMALAPKIRENVLNKLVAQGYRRP